MGERQKGEIWRTETGRERSKASGNGILRLERLMCVIKGEDTMKDER